ncbi:Uncharacterised protein [uncultured archaeon]|nr:Uncharacterised protein [uncultured archaeon]
MASCSNCGARLTNSSHDLCLECFKKEKEIGYRYQVIKGRIAETIIEELFLTLDYNVFRYGMENSIPGVMTLLRGVRGDVAQNIKRMPDFVVQNKRTGEVFFVEVKFRADGEFNYEKLGGDDYPYRNAHIILVSKKHIKCATVEELKNGKEFQYLGSRKEFETDKETIIEFCKFAVQFFKDA